jgi:hypothetical protein
MAKKDKKKPAPKKVAAKKHERDQLSDEQLDGASGGSYTVGQVSQPPPQATPNLDPKTSDSSSTSLFNGVLKGTNHNVRVRTFS